MSAAEVKSALRAVSSPERKKANEWFFKTGPGEYGEGDKFIGVSMGPLRKVSKRFRTLADEELDKLLSSSIHEERLCGLLIMVDQFEKAKQDERREEIYRKYLRAIDDGVVNNWDLVDLTAHKIVGAWLIDKDRTPIYELAKSGQLWHERVAVLACFWFIRQDDFEDVMSIAEILVDHPHDLIHKAVGWMLREVGKRNRDVEERFLKRFQNTIPRSMFRYAID
ncbi:MAG: DNA alkylation repair protein [Candidatus Saccharimonadales bacterium]|nr:DNA alkylation repair protein [Candidatus Saccharimonadales bacterium]